MDKPLVKISYELYNGKLICIDVSIAVRDLLEQSDRQFRSQKRKDRRYLDFVESVDELDTLLTQPQEDTAALVFRMDSYRHLYSAINELPELQRRRLLLYFFNGLTYHQIAKIEGVGIMAIARSIKRAVDALKELYNE